MTTSSTWRSRGGRGGIRLRSKGREEGGRMTVKYIDEEQLIHDLLEASYGLRYALGRSRFSCVTSALLQATTKLNIG